MPCPTCIVTQHTLPGSKPLKGVTPQAYQLPSSSRTRARASTAQAHLPHVADLLRGPATPNPRAGGATAQGAMLLTRGTTLVKVQAFSGPPNAPMRTHILISIVPYRYDPDAENGYPHHHRL